MWIRVFYLFCNDSQVDKIFFISLAELKINKISTIYLYLASNSNYIFDMGKVLFYTLYPHILDSLKEK